MNFRRPEVRLKEVLTKRSFEKVVLSGYICTYFTYLKLSHRQYSSGSNYPFSRATLSIAGRIQIILKCGASDQ
ncbi:MAG: hypothetical protein D6B25_20330 [Desulfobulbaceae bacterium]|nr:MAG: hypothetical protein D6B25_20330 [Desulfobulbaceae bacterium]